MTEPKNALALTHADRLGDGSFEIMRLWVEHGGGSTAWIGSAVMPDPRAFGRLLADAVQHGARAYATAPRSEDAALALILDGFAQTMRSVAPTVVIPRAPDAGA